MEKYELLNQIGDGTFGSVAKAVSKKTGQLVAVKKMKQKFYTWDECVKLPEVDVVRRIHGHPNIVKLREVIRDHNELFFVFEYMDGDLLSVIKKAKQMQRPEMASSSPAIPYPTLRSYMRQVLQALAYLHKRGYFHRDLKPENLLIKHEDSGEDVVKLADFGLVKEIRARPPFTDYVSTRWYRAPELLLQDRAYSSPVDIWAAGCIMAELITTRPLFPGTNEVDQLFKIMSVLGSPTDKSWPAGILLGKKIRYTFPSIAGSSLAAVLPRHIPAQALDLIAQMLLYDPKVRPSAEQCLQHPFFSVGVDESNEPSAAAMQQLATASKRLNHNQPPPAPQSAPAGPVGGVAGGAAATGKKETLASTGEEELATVSTAISPQKYPMLSHGKASETSSQASNGRKPKEPPAAEPVANAPGRDKAAGKALPSNGAKLLLPARRSSSVVPESPSAASQAKSPGSNVKGLHLANLRSGVTKWRPNGSDPKTVQAADEEGTTRSSAAAASPPKLDEPRSASLPQPSGHASVDGPLPKQGSSVTNGEVDLDGLMEEFAAEMSSAGLSAQKRRSNPGDKTLTPTQPSAVAKSDAVAALLANSRYRANSNTGTTMPSRTLANANMSQASKMGGFSAIKGPDNTADATAKDTEKNSTIGAAKSSASPSTNHAASPSIKALLAKHRTGAYTVAQK